MSDLPPLDQPNAYVVVGPDDQRGPYTLELLISEVAAGRLHDATPVWWPGVGDWTTFAANPTMAAELQRRRGQGAAPAQPAPAQPAPAQPAPAQPAETAPPPEAQPAAEQQSDPVLQVDPTAEDFAAVDMPVGNFSVAGGMGLDPIHGAAFADLVARSRARSEAAAVVEQVDERLMESLESAATAAGLSETDQSDTDEQHNRTFAGSGTDDLRVTVAHVTGGEVSDPASHVPFEATYRSTGYSGEGSASTGQHGEVIVVAGEGDTASTASITLSLPISDYLGDDWVVDTQALEKDFAAVIANLKHAIS